MGVGYHEDGLSEGTKDIHRALISLREELEAIDYYQQRADVSTDATLKAVLIHNRNEEIEHASMLLEWLRRNVPEFNGDLGTYLFKDLPITEIEEAATGGEAGGAAGDGSLGIGRAS